MANLTAPVDLSDLARSLLDPAKPPPAFDAAQVPCDACKEVPFDGRPVTVFPLASATAKLCPWCYMAWYEGDYQAGGVPAMIAKSAELKASDMMYQIAKKV